MDLSLPLVLVALIVFNGVFAMSEIAVLTARKARLQQLADEGDLRARAALELAQNPTHFLSTVQIGITSIGILIGVVGEDALAAPLAEWLRQNVASLATWANGIALTVVVIGITVTSIVVGELVPKRLGLMNPEGIARTVAIPMRVLSWVSTPLVKLLGLITDALLRLIGARESQDPVITEEEIQVLMAQGTTAGIFGQSEQQMVRNVFRLDERKLSSLMVPRADVVVLDLDQPLEQTMARIEQSHHSRFPVVRGDFSNVAGFVRAKDLLAQAMTGTRLDLQPLLTPALYVPETLTGSELVENFRDARVQIALVVDEYGDVQGLVTLRDVLEAIVGEVHTTVAGMDDLPAVQRADGSWLLDGMIDVGDLQDRLGMRKLPGESGEDYHTLAGMVMWVLGRIPKTGEYVDWEGWRLEVVDMDGNRVDRLMATKLPEDEVLMG
jgi:putative hemolysin